MIEPDPWPEELSGEVAAPIADCLHRVAHDYKGRYLGQIRQCLANLCQCR